MTNCHQLRGKGMVVFDNLSEWHEAVLDNIFGDPNYHKGQYCTSIGRTYQEGYCKDCSAYKKEG